jgi:hypothetical protein
MGDSYEEVLALVSRTDNVAEKTKDKIVTYGIWDLAGDCRQKIFTFYPGHGLQEIEYNSAPASSCSK